MTSSEQPVELERPGGPDTLENLSSGTDRDSTERRRETLRKVSLSNSTVSHLNPGQVCNAGNIATWPGEAIDIVRLRPDPQIFATQSGLCLLLSLWRG